MYWWNSSLGKHNPKWKGLFCWATWDRACAVSNVLLRSLAKSKSKAGILPARAWVWRLNSMAHENGLEGEPPQQCCSLVFFLMRNSASCILLDRSLEKIRVKGHIFIRWCTILWRHHTSWSYTRFQELQLCISSLVWLKDSNARTVIFTWLAL